MWNGYNVQIAYSNDIHLLATGSDVDGATDTQHPQVHRDLEKGRRVEISKENTYTTVEHTE